MKSEIYILYFEGNVVGFIETISYVDAVAYGIELARTNGLILVLVRKKQQ